MPPPLWAAVALYPGSYPLAPLWAGSDSAVVARPRSGLRAKPNYSLDYFLRRLLARLGSGCLFSLLSSAENLRNFRRFSTFFF